MDGHRGIRGERPRGVPGRVPRDRARGDRLRPVFLPVARGALVLAWRRSHRPDRHGAGVCVRTRVPRRGIARGCESGVPHRARMFRSRCGPGRPVPNRTASVERPMKPGMLPTSDAIVFEEIRPKYALRTAHEESSRGRATLILGRTAPATAARGPGFAAVLPARHASLRALTTASEFLARSCGGLAVVEDLADLSALSEWPSTIEAVVRLRHVARRTGSTVIFSTSRLTDVERRALRDFRFTWWSLPDPAREI